MESLEQRFWSKVEIGNPDECWPWTAAKHRQGYGWFNFQGRMHLAHRIAYWLQFGGTLEGTTYCHKCDNPGCCNPSHLFAGTQQDNIADMDRKGRRPLGEAVSNAKLTNEQARNVRTLYQQGAFNQSQLASQFGIDVSQISRIINHKAYRV